jgi:hypothetical protein
VEIARPQPTLTKLHAQGAEDPDLDKVPLQELPYGFAGMRARAGAPDDRSASSGELMTL